MAVYRVYTEKKPAFAVEAQALLHELRDTLGIAGVTGVRLWNRYDMEGVSEDIFRRCLPIVFYEPQLDECTFALPSGDGIAALFAVEALPGQYDARAASCEECVQLVSQGDRPAVRAARVYALIGTPTAEELTRIQTYVINPVECRLADLRERQTLRQDYAPPEPTVTLTGFRRMTDGQAAEAVARYGLAMDADDLCCCRDHFAAEGRDPTLTELRVMDTYWSDHCRHTTFLTTLDRVTAEKPAVQRAYGRYLALRQELGRAHTPVTLMDIATIGARALRARGKLPNLDSSEEINACSVHVTVTVDGVPEPWLLLFKNETHNHPTEIEPYGGAATCIGGAIRDPLSGRAYVYQAMRVTGAADPTQPIQRTLPGKLPQRKIVTTAAAGYSAYGNQIGLATGLVDELYHEGYAAKRLEIGAVVGAVPLAHMRRETPTPGDAVVLVGGRTGRDGCGGATGSSKRHERTSLETCAAEVQKGNPVVERKLQRLLREGRVARLIKRCNDFGAGGVSVAIGELADGLQIDLDRIPRKYEGLNGTELAISESQERMAFVVSDADVSAMIAFANAENLEATVVARVTAEPRLCMRWRGETVVDIPRAFLNTNGAEKHATAFVAEDGIRPVPETGEPFGQRLARLVGELNICGKQGLAERFDATIGAGTVLMPFGGRFQRTPAQAMAAKFPVLSGHTDTCSGMAYGFHPELMAQSPYEGAYLSVVESLTRLAAAGFDSQQASLTLQEYFPRMTGDAARWGMPLAALLGALDAQLALGVAAIGGKDSMSGTYETLDVPPTLVSFAVAAGDAGQVISPEFKQAGHTLYYLYADPFDGQALLANLTLLRRLIASGKVVSAWAVGLGGIAEGLFKMALGNGLGAHVDDAFPRALFAREIGGVLLELATGAQDGELAAAGLRLGETIAAHNLAYRGETVSLTPLYETYAARLETVYPFRTTPQTAAHPQTLTLPPQAAKAWPKPALRTAKPVAVIPTFPGTNCEVDTARALARAGAEPRIVLLQNLSPAHVAESLVHMGEAIAQAQMLVFPGGFSGGDEPDGSGKFITAFFRNPAMRDAVDNLLTRRDGLVLGICNGFQALVKLGLLPFGHIVDTDAACPTLTFNTIGRHQSMLVRTRVVNNTSPWLQKCTVGDIRLVPVSHGEGRFVCGDAMLGTLIQNGQIATQYVDLDGQPTMDARMNPNGSVLAVEGITSPDGRIFGKMGHTERYDSNLYRNVPGNAFQPIFEGGVAYFA